MSLLTKHYTAGIGTSALEIRRTKEVGRRTIL
jgi:hypothetical protein